MIAQWASQRPDRLAMPNDKLATSKETCTNDESVPLQFYSWLEFFLQIIIDYALIHLYAPPKEKSPTYMKYKNMQKHTLHH